MVRIGFEGVFLAILLMNVFAPTIDHYVVKANVKNMLFIMLVSLLFNSFEYIEISFKRTFKFILAKILS